MDIRVVNSLSGSEKNDLENLLENENLTLEDTPDTTVLIYDENELIATGSRKNSILKYFAVKEERRGEDLTATVLTHLKSDAFSVGKERLFIYTKPKNRLMFTSLFFYPVAETKDVLLLENRKNGVTEFLNGFEVLGGKTVGAAVMNCNPFTLGHRYLIEKAAKECDRVYVFVLSEENPPFKASGRIELVKKSVSDLKNVTVYETGPYLISSATFPTYFLKDKNSAGNTKCELDIKIFGEYFVPKFGINKRYIGSEPFSGTTAEYNKNLKMFLPRYGVEAVEVPRFTVCGTAVSATNVRKLISEKNSAEIKKLVPKTTLEFLKNNNYI